MKIKSKQTKIIIILIQLLGGLNQEKSKNFSVQCYKTKELCTMIFLRIINKYLNYMVLSRYIIL